LHASQKPKKNAIVNVPTTADKTVCVQVSKFGRRPFLQLVVLYASDDRVSKYSDEILEILLSAGIDVVVQNSVQGAVAQTPTAKVPKAKDIKAEHLAELICTSHADFLIVVGDKNMKNKSCQAKRKGKLLEMMVKDVISLIWKSWPQNPHKTLARIKGLTTEQTTSLLFQYCGPKHISDRFEFLCALKKEILSTYKVGSWCDPLDDKLTNLQKCAITLHKQLKKAMKVLSELTVQVENPEMSRGSLKTFEYKPSACRTPKSTIAYPLQIHLYSFIVDMMKGIEATFDIRFPVSMWTEYFSEHITGWHVNLEELDRIQEEMWRAYEEHEKILNQDGAQVEDNQMEDFLDDNQMDNNHLEEGAFEFPERDGMFADLKDDDFDNTLFGELEPSPDAAYQKLGNSGGLSPQSSISSSSHDSTPSQNDSTDQEQPQSQTLKYTFPFPVMRAPIFIPEEKPTTPAAAPVVPEESVPKSVGITRGAVGSGRPGSAGRNSAGLNNGRGTPPAKYPEISRHLKTRESEQSSSSSRITASVSANNLINGNNGNNGSNNRRFCGPRDSSSGTHSHSTPNSRHSSFSENQLPSFKSEKRSKEEKLLAIQLDRQQERRAELERQLMKERELEKELQRQLEKRSQKQKPSDLQPSTSMPTVISTFSDSSHSSHSSLPSMPILDTMPRASLTPKLSFDSLSTANSRLPSLQSSPRSSLAPTSSLDYAVPNVTPKQSPRKPSFLAEDEESPRVHRRSLSFSGEKDNLPRTPSSLFGSASFDYSSSPRIPPGLSPQSSQSFIPFSENGRSIPSLNLREDRLPPLPTNTPFQHDAMLQRNILGVGASTASDLSPREMPMYPSLHHGAAAARRSDPFYQEISKIWGQDQSGFRDHNGDLMNSSDEESPPLTPKGSQLDFRSSFFTVPTSVRRQPPKINLQHGLILKPDPMAST